MISRRSSQVLADVAAGLENQHVVRRKKRGANPRSLGRRASLLLGFGGGNDRDVDDGDDDDVEYTWDDSQAKVLAKLLVDAYAAAERKDALTLAFASVRAERVGL